MVYFPLVLASPPILAAAIMIDGTGATMNRIGLAFAAFALLGACSTAPPAPPAAVAELAPTGKLRAAINFGNPILSPAS
jgi:hypothetical protein